MRATQEKKDSWRMDIKQLEDLVGKKPVDVRVENKHVVVYFDNNLRVLFKKW